MKSLRNGIIYTFLLVCSFTPWTPIISYYNSVSPIIVVSPPKAGTHLISKLLEEMMGKEAFFAPLPYVTSIRQSDINKLAYNEFLITHAPYTKHNAQVAKQNKAKIILILRDPRDVIPSYVEWLKKSYANKPWREGKTLEPEWPLFGHLSTTDMISHFIRKYPTKGPQVPTYTTITELYNLYLAWSQYPEIYITTFEKLVGAQGGGSQIEQETEIKTIAAFINMPITDQQAQLLGRPLFGGTNTFRKGQIGSWKRELTQHHVEALKRMPGLTELLIRLGYAQNKNW